MSALTAQDLLKIWEWGEGRHPVDQALTILSVAYPEKDWEEITALDLSQRDGLLLALRERTFGPRMEGFAVCPHCDQQLEFDLEMPGLPEPVAAPGERTVWVDGYEIRFRLPNSLDLAAIASLDSVEAAREALLQRIIIHVHQDEAVIPYQSLSSQVITSLGEQLSSQDPLLETQLTLLCPYCEHSWAVFLDVISFFWVEITTRARRLLGEVHTLARAYGWPEADILALSPRRRKMYLQMVTL